MDNTPDKKKNNCQVEYENDRIALVCCPNKSECDCLYYGPDSLHSATYCYDGTVGFSPCAYRGGRYCERVNVVDYPTPVTYSVHSCARTEAREDALIELCERIKQNRVNAKNSQG